VVVRNKPLLVLTGGGTAGHVMPHVAMLQSYADAGYAVAYIGSDGIEKKLIKSQAVGINFYQIQVGKLRRYVSIKNLTDIFRILIGFFQSLAILRKLKPALVFSKGGFVSVPVAYAARALGIPVVSHESDLTPGLANKLIAPIASKLLYSFPESKAFLPASRSQLVGIPVRRELFQGDKKRAREFLGFKGTNLPVILVMGGSLGAQRINSVLSDALPELLIKFQIIHITGKGKQIDVSHDNYRSYEFLNEQLGDVMELSDLVVSRAGANSIFEFLALKKPMILIPLEAGSRGDQIQNANCFQKMGVATVLREVDLDKKTFIEAIITMIDKTSCSGLEAAAVPDVFKLAANDQIIKIINSLTASEDSA
jgi:UDP-N-acetylglucosamine--N-acetylmuramyl-(pentapeptide) pyrophosphoryl-undecaprenol N-acetylglucosamine transferase